MSKYKRFVMNALFKFTPLTKNSTISVQTNNLRGTLRRAVSFVEHLQNL